MRRIRVVGWCLALSAAAGVAPGTGWAQSRGVVLNRDVASTIPQLRRKISLDLRGTSLDGALRAVAKEAALSITYNDAILPGGRRVWLTADDIRTDRALEEILRDSGLRLLALSSGQVVMVKDRPRPPARERADSLATVTGRVTAQATGGRSRGRVLPSRSRAVRCARRPATAAPSRSGTYPGASAPSRCGTSATSRSPRRSSWIRRRSPWTLP